MILIILMLIQLLLYKKKFNIEFGITEKNCPVQSPISHKLIHPIDYKRVKNTPRAA